MGVPGMNLHIATPSVSTKTFATIPPKNPFKARILQQTRNHIFQELLCTVSIRATAFLVSFGYPLLVILALR
jgi:hypothetical protein